MSDSCLRRYDCLNLCFWYPRGDSYDFISGGLCDNLRGVRLSRARRFVLSSLAYGWGAAKPFETGYALKRKKERKKEAASCCYLAPSRA